MCRLASLIAYQKYTPHHLTPHLTTPPHTLPHHTTLHTSPPYTTPHHTTLHYSTTHHHITPYHTTVPPPHTPHFTHTSSIVVPICAGESTTCTPAALRAAILSSAPPLPVKSRFCQIKVCSKSIFLSDKLTTLTYRNVLKVQILSDKSVLEVHILSDESVFRTYFV